MEECWIRVQLSGQRLELLEGADVVATYPVSTARNGPGEVVGSECTPRGEHTVHAKIGGGEPTGTVFVGRRSTGEICSAERFREEPERDWILTRILWLSGCDAGRNRDGNVDTLSRYIYIHGAPDEIPMDVPSSHGCIRMRNADVEELDRVGEGTRVRIEE
jgi:lipoprotein-anchoring transpeptidase ErfK/SrfK